MDNEVWCDVHQQIHQGRERYATVPCHQCKRITSFPCGTCEQCQSEARAKLGEGGGSDLGTLNSDV